jgi:hypothetical protein
MRKFDDPVKQALADMPWCDVNAPLGDLFNELVAYIKDERADAYALGHSDGWAACEDNA